jgi:hypothetical protein
MPVRAQIDSSQLRLVARKVKLLDPEIRKEMIKGLKTDLKPYANQIAADVPVLGSPGRMRGFGHGGRTSWGPVQGSAYVTPGGGKGSVARMEIFGRGQKRAAFKIADLAGTKNNYGNGNMAKLPGGQALYQIMGQGQDMVSRLTDFGKLSAGGKGGRFAWAGFMKYRPLFLKVTINRLDSYAQKVGERILL